MNNSKKLTPNQKQVKSDLLNIVGDPDKFYPAWVNPRLRKKQIFQTQWDPNPVYLVKDYGVSETSPNFAFTAEQIINRFRQGIPINIGSIPVYEGDELVYRDIKAMEPVERQLYAEVLEAHYEEITARIQARKSQVSSRLIAKRIAEDQAKKHLQGDQGGGSKPPNSTSSLDE